MIGVGRIFDAFDFFSFQILALRDKFGNALEIFVVVGFQAFEVSSGNAGFRCVRSVLHPHRKPATPPGETLISGKRILLLSADGNLRAPMRSFLEHAGFDAVNCA